MLVMRHMAANPLHHQYELLVAHRSDVFDEQLAAVCDHARIEWCATGDDYVYSVVVCHAWMLIPCLYTTSMHEWCAIAPCHSAQHHGICSTGQTRRPMPQAVCMHL